MRIAIIGTGISGLGAAWALRHRAQITLFEAGSHFGGHTHTVDVDLPGELPFAVDTGFLVLNERTYPRLQALFAELNIPLATSDMSFSVQTPLAGGDTLEWSGSNLDTVFAQRRNLARPAFWRMLRDILRFNREATALARRPDAELDADLTVGQYLRREGYGDTFLHWYLLPMTACIWSCPPGQMLDFPLATLVRFCDNHGLLQVNDRPQWFTVRGGARQYVQAMLAQLPDARLNTPVHRVTRHDDGVEVHTHEGPIWFDRVIFACHSDQALALLDAPSPAEQEVLGTIRYQPNRALLHTDTRLLPRARRAWASWNYESGAATGAQAPTVCLHYLLNKLQPLPTQRPIVVSLNPLREPAPHTVLREISYAHPIFDRAAITAQRRVPELQGRQHSYFCGAWCGYGFHEDGLKSGFEAAQALLSDLDAQGAYRALAA
ncbi:NAD(P)/FAD-dependent oxidoreductase [Thiomonas bhubaneswarensis]|uniref:Predicted NAD/FAD-binding protein n=1 Tax=Thiomonas bhubaneswarensis TaxID=339866 RepID=A0A0K6HPX0_9BURK|nr:FAD-dependent oxidoreductase [Thiomonas bhubaneswarensis]CUA92929.1 Predicted NAD/FAD-binding protein [Thiomonas bhubaneswarensis]